MFLTNRTQCVAIKNSRSAAMLPKGSIIIWDECTMAHKHSLEVLHRTSRDLDGNDKLFGGAILLLSGDFWQTLPVIPRYTYFDEVNACLKQLFLWRSVEIVQYFLNNYWIWTTVKSNHIQTHIASNYQKIYTIVNQNIN